MCVRKEQEVGEIRRGREIMRGRRGGLPILVWSRSAQFKHCV